MTIRDDPESLESSGKEPGNNEDEFNGGSVWEQPTATIVADVLAVEPLSSSDRLGTIPMASEPAPTYKVADVLSVEPGNFATDATAAPAFRPVAVAVASSDQDERKGDLCCGACCDFRTACIIMNSIWLVFYVFGLLAALFGREWFSIISASDDVKQLDDDFVQQSFDASGTVFLVVIILAGLGIFFSFVGIIGAAIFQKWLVLAAALWYCGEFALYLVSGNWSAAIVVGSIIYPHFCLFKAIKIGTMTRETFAREQHCCCKENV